MRSHVAEKRHQKKRVKEPKMSWKTKVLGRMLRKEAEGEEKLQ